MTAPRWELDDPAAFAHSLYSALAADGDPRVNDYAPADRDAYHAARAAVFARYPADAADGRSALHAMDEAAYAWAGRAHAAGIEFGLAAERLRRELLAAAPGPRIPWLAPPAVEPPAEPPDPVPTGRRRRVVVRDVAGVLSANLDGRLVTSSLHFERDAGGAWAIGVDEDGAGSCAALVYLKPEDSADAAITRLLSALAHVNRPPADEDDRAAD